MKDRNKGKEDSRSTKLSLIEQWGLVERGLY